MPLPEYAIALGDVYAEMGDRQKADEQYDLVREIDRLYRANGVNTDLEIALFYADHDLDLQTSLEKARSAYQEVLRSPGGFDRERAAARALLSSLK